MLFTSRTLLSRRLCSISDAPSTPCCALVNWGLLSHHIPLNVFRVFSLKCHEQLHPSVIQELEPKSFFFFFSPPTVKPGSGAGAGEHPSHQCLRTSTVPGRAERAGGGPRESPTKARSGIWGFVGNASRSVSGASWTMNDWKMPGSCVVHLNQRMRSTVLRLSIRRKREDSTV